MAEKSTDKDWLQLAQKVFRDGTQYYDDHMRSQWENNERMFRNKHSKQSKYTSSMYAKRSTLFRPKTRTSGMKFEAAVANAYFSTNDIVDIAPVNTSNPLQRASSKLMGNLLQYRLTKSIPWFRLVTGAAQEAWKMGSVVSFQSWKFQEDSDGNIVIDRPDVELIPMENLRISAAADWRDPIGTTPYIVHMLPMYVHEIKARIKGDGVNPSWNKIDESEISKAKRAESDPLRLARNDNKTPPQEESSSVDDYDIVFVHRNIVNYNGDDYIYYTLGVTALLSEPTLLAEEFPIGRPYAMGSCMIEPHKVFNTSPVELGQSLQEEINEVANNRLDNVKYVLHKRYFGKRGRNIDLRSLLRNVPGSVTMMDNPLEDVQVVNTPDITQSAYIEQDRLNVDYDELVGNFSTSSVQTNQSLGGTVGGMGMAASGAGQITEYQLRIFNESWVEKVVDQLIRLEQIYEDDEVILKVASNSPEILDLGEDVDVDELLSQELYVNINVGISATNPQFKLEKFLFGIRSAADVLSSPSSNLFDSQEIIKEIMGLVGYRGGARFFAGMKDGQDPVMLAMQQQIAQLTSMVDGKRMELEMKSQLDQATIQLKQQELQIDEAKTVGEMQALQAEMEKTYAEIREIDAKIQEMQSQDSGLEVEKFRLDAIRLSQERERYLADNKTKRDKIVADLVKSREDNEAKLKITLANRNGGMGVSNNIMDLGDTRFMAIGGDIKEGELAVVGEEGPEAVVSSDEPISDEAIRQYFIDKGYDMNADRESILKDMQTYKLGPSVVGSALGYSPQQIDDYMKKGSSNIPEWEQPYREARGLDASNKLTTQQRIQAMSDYLFKTGASTPPPVAPIDEGDTALPLLDLGDYADILEQPPEPLLLRLQDMPASRTEHIYTINTKLRNEEPNEHVIAGFYKEYDRQVNEFLDEQKKLLKKDKNVNPYQIEQILWQSYPQFRDTIKRGISSPSIYDVLSGREKGDASTGESSPAGRGTMGGSYGGPGNAGGFGDDTGDTGNTALNGGELPRGKVSLVGENGPELIKATDDVTVIPADETKKILARGDASVVDAGTTTVRENDAELDKIAAQVTQRELVKEAPKRKLPKEPEMMSSHQSEPEMMASHKKSNKIKPKAVKMRVDIPEFAKIGSDQSGLPQDLLEAVIMKESSGISTAKNKKSGASGLMQLTPIAVEEVNRLKLIGEGDITFDQVRESPELNVQVGSTYLKHLIDKFDSVQLGLAAYNAGEGKVRRAGNKIPNIKETKDYVKKIMSTVSQ